MYETMCTGQPHRAASSPSNFEDYKKKKRRTEIHDYLLYE